MEITLGGDGWVVGQGCRLLVTATVPLQTDLAEGRRQPLQGWMSPDYGQRRPAPMLIYSAITRLPLRVVSLIFPADQPPAVVAAALEHRRIDLLFEDCMETLHIGDRDMVMERLPHAVTQPDPARPAPIC
jgi:hypothetical protein